MSTIFTPNWIHYLHLTRIHKPIGAWLLLWPTLWALWIAAEGVPDLSLLIIFTLGVFLTRSAGCVINDYADRHIDRHVKRTASRPLTTGKVSERGALILFTTLMGAAFLLVLLTNRFTLFLSFIAAALASSYPFMKRYTHLPQLVLGAAFSFSIPMAFAATLNEIPFTAWLLFCASFLWTVAYDTQYAMVDRDDDLKIGVKSTAILFGHADKHIIALLHIFTLIFLCLTGWMEQFSGIYYLSIVAVTGFFLRQHYMMRTRERDACFQAFLNNHWAELCVFLGIAFHFAI